MSIALSPYGEGYCRTCQFIVGLDERGRLEKHWRGRTGVCYEPDPPACSGGGKRPGRRVPYWTVRGRFYYDPWRAQCPACNQETKVLPIAGGLYWGIHHTPSGVKCHFYNQPVSRGTRIRYR